MKLITISTYMMGLGLWLSACNHEVPDIEFTPYANELADTAWARNADGSAALFSYNLVDSLLLPPVQPLSYSPIQPDTLRVNGAMFALPALPFALPGSGTVGSVPITAPVELTLRTAFTNGDLVRQSLSTTTPNTAHKSGGIFTLRARINQVDLVLRQGAEITISRPVTASLLVPAMTLYQPQPGTGNSLWTNWWPLQDSSRIVMPSGSNQWQIHIRRLGTVAALEPQNNGQPKNLFAVLPAVFTNKNTVVYMAAANALSVQRFLPETADKLFALRGTAPANADKVFAISYRQGQWYLASLSLSPNSSTLIRFEPQPVSSAQIQQFLDGL